MHFCLNLKTSKFYSADNKTNVTKKTKKIVSNPFKDILRKGFI